MAKLDKLAISRKLQVNPEFFGEGDVTSGMLTYLFPYNLRSSISSILSSGTTTVEEIFAETEIPPEVTLEHLDRFTGYGHLNYAGLRIINGRLTQQALKELAPTTIRDADFGSGDFDRRFTRGELDLIFPAEHTRRDILSVCQLDYPDAISKTNLRMGLEQVVDSTDRVMDYLEQIPHSNFWTERQIEKELGEGLLVEDIPINFGPLGIRFPVTYQNEPQDPVHKIFLISQNSRHESPYLHGHLLPNLESTHGTMIELAARFGREERVLTYFSHLEPTSVYTTSDAIEILKKTGRMSADTISKLLNSGRIPGAQKEGTKWEIPGWSLLYYMMTRQRRRVLHDSSDRMQPEALKAPKGSPLFQGRLIPDFEGYRGSLRDVFSSADGNDPRIQEIDFDKPCYITAEVADLIKVRARSKLTVVSQYVSQGRIPGTVMDEGIRKVSPWGVAYYLLTVDEKRSNVALDAHERFSDAFASIAPVDNYMAHLATLNSLNPKIRDAFLKIGRSQLKEDPRAEEFQLTPLQVLDLYQACIVAYPLQDSPLTSRVDLEFSMNQRDESLIWLGAFLGCRRVFQKRGDYSKIRVLFGAQSYEETPIDHLSNSIPISPYSQTSTYIESHGLAIAKSDRARLDLNDVLQWEDHPFLDLPLLVSRSQASKRVILADHDNPQYYATLLGRDPDFRRGIVISGPRGYLMQKNAKKATVRWNEVDTDGDLAIPSENDLTRKRFLDTIGGKETSISEPMAQALGMINLLLRKDGVGSYGDQLDIARREVRTGYALNNLCFISGHHRLFG